MNRAKIFAFRVSDAEKRAIALLAAQLQRSKSDAVRFVISEALKRLTQADSRSTDSVPAADQKR